ncbi:calcineurin B-like protein 2 isoform X6 [Prunus dulcis]|uniref:calcineurin B-like protein 2 isoform X6 n=1 Tax=Prunus dulcis TaxID=3755 RepID=UPI00148324D7|nr:calcineurin B-like protein 2 isoform X6 [Prunus dulcis]
MTSNERSRLFLRDLLFRIENSAYTESSSSLMLGKKLCAVFKPLIDLVESFIFSLIGCFDRQRPHQRLSYTYDDIVRLAASSPFTVNEVEALRELFNQLSSSILDDGLIHKEELRLALFKTPAGENLFLDRVRQMVVATLLESGIHVPDETLEAIVDKTFADADSDKDDKISKDEWKAFALQHPTLLKNMTLPHLKYLLTAIPLLLILLRFYHCFQRSFSNHPLPFLCFQGHHDSLPELYFQHRSRRLMLAMLFLK